MAGVLWGTVAGCQEGRAGQARLGVVLCLREGLDCTVLAVGDDTVESLWVRIKGKVDVVVGVCCQPPSRGDTTDELFYKQLRDLSRSAALVLISDFNFPDVD